MGVESINLLNSSNNSLEDTQKIGSFHSKKCKLIRVTCDFLSSVISAIFYKTISGASWILGMKAANEKYSQLATYHWNVGFNRLGSYIQFGNRIINFATNNSGKPKEYKSEKVNEFEELKSIYGDRFEKMLEQVDSTDYPILKEKLARLLVDDGICLGSALDFASRLLKLNHKNPNWLENIEKVSALFKEHGTEEAQLIQILMRAQNIEKIQETRLAHNETLIKKVDEEQLLFQRKLRSEQDRIKQEYKSEAHDPQEIKKQKLAEAKKEIEKSGKEIISEHRDRVNRVRDEIFGLNALLDLERIQPFAKLLGLDMNLKHVLIDEDIKGKVPPPSFENIMKELPPGAYLLLLSCSADAAAGHAINFIKASNEESYIFDPNFSTIKEGCQKESTSDLWGLIKGFYNTNGECSLNLYQLDLDQE